MKTSSFYCSLPLLARLLLSVLLLGAPLANGQVIGNHRAVYDAHGTLQAWTSWSDALAREVNWYLNCPVEQGYPRFICLTFMDGDYKPIQDRPSFIPGM